MALSITRHNRRIDNGDGIDVLGEQLGDAIEVADGAVSAELADEGFYRIVADGKTRMRIGDNTLADATGGELWPDGQYEVRFIEAGSKIASAAA